MIHYGKNKKKKYRIQYFDLRLCFQMKLYVKFEYNCLENRASNKKFYSVFFLIFSYGIMLYTLLHVYMYVYLFCYFVCDLTLYEIYDEDSFFTLKI